MSEQQRDESGHFSEKVTDRDVLEVFQRTSEPVLTAREVASELPITREATVRRLNRMHESGLLDRKDAGSSAVVWWTTGERDDGGKNNTENETMDETAFARQLSRQAIATRYSDDYFGQHPGWDEGLDDLGENA